MPAAAAIPLITAGIGAGSSILGGVLGSRAAGQAGEIQSEAAAREAQAFRDVLDKVNPAIGTAAERGAEEVRTAAREAGAGVTGAAGTAQELLAPYLGIGTESVGTLRDLMAPGGELNRTFTAADMAAYDPGYQFRLQEAQKAIESSAAARGGALGGGTLKALIQRSQDVASSEFGAAHERFRQQQADRFGRLNSLVNLGVGAAGQSGQFGLRGAEYAGTAGQAAAEFAGRAGMSAAEQQAANALATQRSIADLMTGGAASEAAGRVGSANAWTGALSGVAGAAGGLARSYQDEQTLRTLMQNPAIQPAVNVFDLPGSYGGYRNPALVPGWNGLGQMSYR